MVACWIIASLLVLLCPRERQLHGQHWWILWLQDHWRSELAHRLIPRRIYFYGCVLDHRITAGAAMPARAGLIQMGLTYL